ncbi:hypothetical protein G3I59_31855 [Amycolatopsis rubida]|uniref:Uncharacterized protein n=2 Tax=Amycolatopsis TaxID=1813 RepID=A0A2N3WP55_9PSEU|nr:MULTISPECIES: hypothetical protein [Amycolatopsis]MYW95069.1 hypothetical protein [Amycolatopsis rubida]NEC60056.1 hypothetical protein [Amycolatopsis rubida]OAP26361.1 hypothetical protein A4R44_02348 [Amycolatopsis sp. M39]PKV95651.1 hypothetical protein ATK30_6577 [Amycolatopsis niigatensis]SFP39348.1 hypothetical protein SAMN05421854_105136 [Amycolatopsis rubida]
MVLTSVLVIVALIAVLAGYLFVVGGQLTRVAALLEECAELVRAIKANAEPIRPGLDHINRTGGVVAGALPLLYGFAEGIVTGVSPRRDPDPDDRLPARPASGTRRSRLHDGVGYRPEGVPAAAGHGPPRSGA